MMTIATTIECMFWKRQKGDAKDLLQQESKWMLRLGTREPYGLNIGCGEVGSI